MKTKTLYLISAILFISTVNAQISRSEYCKCEIKGNKTSVQSTDNKIGLVSNYSEGKLHLKITNNSNDTIYIFKSYFDNEISTSEYLYRYDKRSNSVNISFVPLLPYVFTKYSDRIVSNDRVITDNQVVYDFYTILPFSEYSFSVPALNFKEKIEFTKDFDTSTLNKFEKIKGIKKKRCVKGKNPSFYVNIAYYSNVQTLCNSNTYYQEELTFNDSARRFKILRSELN